MSDSVNARELLERGVAQARETAGQPALQAQMLDVIGQLYTELGDYDRAAPLLEEALAIRHGLHGEKHLDYVTSLQNLADLMSRRQEGARSIDLRQRVLALRRELSGNTHPKTLDAIWELGMSQHWGGGRADSSALFREWMAAAASNSEISATRAIQLRDASAILEYQGDLEQAEKLLRQAVMVQQQVLGERHHLTAMSLSQLGDLLSRRNKVAEGQALCRRAVESLRLTYPEGHPNLAMVLREYAFTLTRAGQWSEAVSLLREVLEMRRRFPSPIDIAMSTMDLSNALNRTDDYVESERLAQEAISIFTSQMGPGNAMAVYAGVHLGEALRGQGRYREAEPLLLAGYKRFEVRKPVTAQWRNHSLAALVRLYEAQGRLDESARYRALADPPLPISVSPR
jgi:serine/threonine-protein kinase